MQHVGFLAYDYLGTKLALCNEYAATRWPLSQNVSTNPILITTASL